MSCIFKPYFDIAAQHPKQLTQRKKENKNTLQKSLPGFVQGTFTSLSNIAMKLKKKEEAVCYVLNSRKEGVITLRPRQNGGHFANASFK